MNTSNKPTSYYKNTLKELNKNYYSVLDEMVKVFPKYKLYPNFQSYSKDYTEDMGTINKIQTEFFLFRNNLNSESDSIDKDIKKINNQIAKLEKENKHLTKTLDSLNNSNNASHGMLSDTKLLYNQELSGNWLLTFILIGVVYKYYK
jgi:septal ring factor EnvC (AmiA/AmiB activator)